jgi:sterol desaturase/sphingolipid hydroxylase (fatty acid hydroxylase superfamily)
MHFISSDDVIWFLLPLLVFVPIERLFAARPSQRLFRRAWLTDLTYLFVNWPIIRIGLTALLVGVGMGARYLVPDRVHAALGSQPIWAQIVQVFVVADLGFYLAHRAFHAVPVLWRFHAIHHSIEELDWLAGARVHPLDQIVTKGVSVLPPFILGYSESAIAVFGVVYFWHSFLLHANVNLGFGPLNAIVASPRFHHWHHANDHAARDKNFAGQLSLLDRLFGTYYLPADRKPAGYGIDDRVPGTYLRNLAYPLLRSHLARVEPARSVDGSVGVL